MAEAAITGLDPATCEVLRRLAQQWHRCAESTFRHNALETEPLLQQLHEGRAQMQRRCAEELESIVGEADPF